MNEAPTSDASREPNPSPNPGLDMRPNPKLFESINDSPALAGALAGVTATVLTAAITKDVKWAVSTGVVSFGLATYVAHRKIERARAGAPKSIVRKRNPSVVTVASGLIIVGAGAWAIHHAMTRSKEAAPVTGDIPGPDEIPVPEETLNGTMYGWPWIAKVTPEGYASVDVKSPVDGWHRSVLGLPGATEEMLRDEIQAYIEQQIWTTGDQTPPAIRVTAGTEFMIPTPIVSEGETCGTPDVKSSGMAEIETICFQPNGSTSSQIWLKIVRQSPGTENLMIYDESGTLRGQAVVIFT